MPKTRIRATKKDGKIAITLDVREYEKLLKDLEELDSIRAYDAAKRSGEIPIPFERTARKA
jgi:hypothetical protein